MRSLILMLAAFESITCTSPAFNYANESKSGLGGSRSPSAEKRKILRKKRNRKNKRRN